MTPPWQARLLPKISEPETPPWRLLPHLLLLAFVLRAALTLSGDFIIHPDEITQYLEPAHALVFGSGVFTWEYYYGGRSWLVPYAVAAILFLCKSLGFGEPAYYIPAVRLTLCALSLLIPLSMYHLGRRLFSETTARIALLLGVFWYELVGFAHKPMTEFIATALFLGWMVYTLRPQPLTRTQAVLAGVFAAFVVAVRFQYAPLVGLVWLLLSVRSVRSTRVLLIVGTAIGVGAVGMFDVFTWGGFLQPYWINFHFNAALDAYRIAYEGTAGVYLLWLLIASGGLALPALASALGNRQRVFILLLCLTVFLPHEVQVHREYRFLFALVPLWLLLCADFLVSGVRGKKTGGNLRWRRGVLCIWVVLASAAGIANALPAQERLYDYRDSTAPYPYYGRFLRQQDELLALYRQLAADDSVRGVKDAVHRYYKSGGYYTLHHKVPFYDKQLFSAEDMQHYVSHLIALPPMSIQGAQQTADGKWVLLSADGRVLELPAYVADAARGTLVYWDINGSSSEVEGFALAQSGRQFTLWKAEASSPVREWKDYRVYLSDTGQHILLERAIGGLNKPPLTSHGIEFADAPAAH